MFYSLGTVPLLDPDEPVYAETPKEMTAFNDFLSPRIYGEFWYDKPPLYYWLVAGAFQLFGMNEFAARFPSALLAVAGVLAVYLFSLELFNKRAALVGALVLATSVEYLYLGKAAVTDMTLNFCLLLALLGFITKRYYLLYFFAGMATVAKGPIGFLFPGAIIFLYLLATGRFRLLTEMKLGTGILLFCVVALPWYLFMYYVHGNAFVDTFLGFHNITRFTSPEHPEVLVWYYFIPVLILGFFPWTAILAQSLWASLTQSGQNKRTLLFLHIWSAFIFLFFSLSQTKLVSYILPMYPPLAIIAGWYIDRMWKMRERYIAWPIILGILSLLIIAGMFTGLKLMPALADGIMVTTALFVLMAICSGWFTWRQQIGKVFWTQVAGMTLFSLVLVSLLFSAAAPQFTSKYIAREFVNHYDGASPVYIIKFLHPGFTFYSNVYGSEMKKEELAAVVNRPGKGYLIIQQNEYKLLTEPEKVKVKVVAEAADRMILVKVIDN